MENFKISTRKVENVKKEVVQTVTTIQPKFKNKKISFDDIDKLYQRLRIKSNNENKSFMIKGMTYDGMKTLKDFHYDDETLRFSNGHDYYRNMPIEAQDKFNHFFFVQIISYPNA